MIHQTAGVICATFTRGPHRAELLMGDCRPLVVRTGVNRHSSTATQAEGLTELCYLQSPNARDVRMVGSEVRRSGVSGG